MPPACIACPLALLACLHRLPACVACLLALLALLAPPVRLHHKVK